MAEFVLVDYGEKSIDTPEILALIKKAGYDTMTVATRL